MIFSTRISSLLNKVSWHLVIYVMVLLSPSLMFSAQGTFRATYPLLILLSLINRWKPFLASTLPIILLIPSAWFLQWTFKAPMNESFWLIMSGTNVAEAGDYLKENAIVPLLLSVLAFLYWLYLFKKVEIRTLIQSKTLRYFFLSLTIIPMFHTFKGRHNLLGEFNHHFTASFPFNIVFSYKAAQNDLKRFLASEGFNNISDLKILEEGPDRQTIVIVLGESARRDRLQLFGATTPNNPELNKIKDELYLFKDLITLHPHTVASIPVILSKQTGVQESFQPQYSFVDVFKAAGYKTFWISNQASLFGKYSLIGQFARSADFSHFFHYHAANPIIHDGVVSDLFKEKVSDKATKKLFVLHLQGSHYSFSKRYPLQFDDFEDDYDNSLQYTDYILAEVIEALKKQNQTAMMFYVSDHGLLLNDCGKKYTHFDNKESFEVPALLWISSDWKSKHSRKIDILKTNLTKPLSTQVVFDSLVDLAGISYSDRDEKLSFLSPKVDVGTRLVKTYSKMVDYDLGKNDSKCHLE